MHLAAPVDFVELTTDRRRARRRRGRRRTSAGPAGTGRCRRARLAALGRRGARASRLPPSAHRPAGAAGGRAGGACPPGGAALPDRPRRVPRQPRRAVCPAHALAPRRRCRPDAAPLPRSRSVGRSTCSAAATVVDPLRPVRGRLRTCRPDGRDHRRRLRVVPAAGDPPAAHRLLTDRAAGRPPSTRAQRRRRLGRPSTVRRRRTRGDTGRPRRRAGRARLPDLTAARGPSWPATRADALSGRRPPRSSWSTSVRRRRPADPPGPRAVAAAASRRGAAMSVPGVARGAPSRSPGHRARTHRALGPHAAPVTVAGPRRRPRDRSTATAPAGSTGVRRLQVMAMCPHRAASPAARRGPAGRYLAQLGTAAGRSTPARASSRTRAVRCSASSARRLLGHGVTVARLGGRAAAARSRRRCGVPARPVPARSLTTVADERDGWRVHRRAVGRRRRRRRRSASRGTGWRDARAADRDVAG